MPRKRNNGLSEEKRNIIGQLVEIYDIKTAADIQEALKDLLGGTRCWKRSCPRKCRSKRKLIRSTETAGTAINRRLWSLAWEKSRYPCYRIEIVILSRRSCRSTRGTSRRSRARSSACMRAEWACGRSGQGHLRLRREWRHGNLPRPSRRKRRGLRWRWTIRIRRQRPPAPESWNLWLRHKSRVYRIFWTEPEED